MNNYNFDTLSKAEQELSLILTHAGEGIYGLDLNGKTTFVNNAAAEMVGLELDDLKGRCNHTLVHYKHHDGSHYPKSECPIYSTLQDGVPRNGDDEYFIRKSGEAFPIEYFVNPIIQNGKLKGAVVTFIDITERKKKEALLYKYQHKLEELVKAKTSELQIANEELRKLSITDGLTGIANRRCFDEVLFIEISRAKRHFRPLALILGDVDFFKKYNDAYGHSAGDVCLKNIGAVLKDTFKRSGDLVARYGGEEFAIILPDLQEKKLEEMLEKVQRNIFKLKIKHKFSSVNEFITMSFGVIYLIPKEHTNCSFIEKADKALYMAKNQGRNQFFISKK